MVIGAHRDDAHAAHLPHPADCFNSLRRCFREGCQDTPAVAKQLGEAGLGSRMLGSGDRVSGDEMNAGRNMRLQVADHHLLDRSDIGQDRAIHQHRADPLTDLRVGGERRCDHNQVRAFGRFCRVVGGAVGQLQAPYCRQGLGAARASDDRRVRAVPAQYSSEGRPDQPDPDQPDPLEQPLAHRAAMNSASLSTTVSISGPVPIVILRH